MVKKLIIFDIDGTLINDHLEILDSSKEAIKILRAAGHDTAIATGRNALMSREIIENLDFHQYIVCNGAEAFSNHETIYKNPLDKEALYRLIELADRENHPVVYETAHEFLRRSSEIGDRIKHGMKFVGQSVPAYDESGRFHIENELTQLLLFNNEAEEHLYNNGAFPEFRFVRWYEDAVDVLPADGSKAETIAHFAEHKGYKPEDVVAFGDGNNDAEMIREAGIGVAMDNAVPKVKDAADLITDSNNEDGIYKALKKLDLI